MIKKWITKHSKSLQGNIIASKGGDRQQQLRGRWQDARYIALDLETDGLDPAVDAILAFGWVPLAPPRIRLFEADYGVVKSEKSLSQSAVIHHLSEGDIRSGEPIERILKRLAEHLDGAVLVAHHAPFDWQFLQQAFNEHQIPCQPLALMDTLKIERNRLARKKDWLEQGELTLGACRDRYDLPTMRQHHALSDAIACAELFLAQAYQVVGSHEVSLRELLRYA
ncbi:MAG: 3'-5' exonuclease [Idiomarina sp.]|nr:3'-5' exonuclease [Idiomarina sp.]